MGAKKFIKSFFRKYTEQNVPVELDLWPAIMNRFQSSNKEVANDQPDARFDGDPKPLSARLPEVIRKSNKMIPLKPKESNMKEEKQGDGVRISRRDFLKVSGATAAAVAAVGATRRPVLHSLEEIDRKVKAAEASEQIFVNVCRPNCFGECGLNVHVRDGKIVKTSPADYPDKKYNRICLRGLSHVQRVYSPDRIKYPMKRAGERGEDKWERITWEEAITTITDKWKSIAEEYGPQAVSWIIGSGNYGSWGNIHRRLINIIGATTLGYDVDVASLLGINRVLGWSGLWHSSDEADMVNSKTMISWGCNSTNAQPQSWHFIADAIERGMKLIVIDPVYTILASKAHEYIPIRPGADAALTLSMMQVIISEKLHNVEFLLAHTVAPFLVREDTKLFLRMSDIGVAPIDGPLGADGQPTKIDPIAVWDPAKLSAVAVGSIDAPALEGSHTVIGIKVRTAFDLLKEEVDQYPPEVASKLTDIDPDTIRHLALVSADTPVRHYAGWGSQAYDNGTHASHALATLAAITGNIGYPGASVGGQWNSWPGGNAAFTVPTGTAGPSMSNLVYRTVVKTGLFQGKPYPIKSLFVAYGNPANTLPNTKEWIEILNPSFDLVVVADSLFTDTARYADIVLPTADYLECQDIVAQGPLYHAQYAEKAIEPLYESKSDQDIIRMLADKMGVGEHFTKSDEEYLAEIIRSSFSEQMGITLENLKEKRAIRFMPDPYIDCAGAVFYTATGRAEFYLENPTPMAGSNEILDVDRERLPRFFPPTEAWPDTPAQKKYPLVLLSERPRFRVHSQWFSTPWLRELEPEPFVKINVNDAVARNIKTGDYIEVFNDRGRAVVKAVLTQGVRPGAMVFAKGWQAKQYKAGDLSQLASSHFDPYSVNASFMDETVEVRKWNGEV